MPICKIIRYARGCRTQHEFQIPSRVTITGTENHFQRAYEDACLLMEGMSRLDADLYEQSESPVKGDSARYWIESVSMN